MGTLLFGFARLPWLSYVEPVLSSKYPEFTLHSKNCISTIEIENFGQVASTTSKVIIEYLEQGQWKVYQTKEIPSLQPYEKIMLTLLGEKIGNRNTAVEVKVTILSKNQAPVLLEGKIVVR